MQPTMGMHRQCAVIESGDQIEEDAADHADNEIQNETFDYVQPKQGSCQAVLFSNRPLHC